MIASCHRLARIYIVSSRGEGGGVFGFSGQCDPVSWGRCSCLNCRFDWNFHGGSPLVRSVGGDEVALLYEAYLATHADRGFFIADAGNARLLSVKLGYHVNRQVRIRFFQIGW